LTPLAALASIWFMMANLQLEAILIGLGLVVIGVGAAAVFGGPDEDDAESPAGKAPDGTSLRT
jgi:hypothetical protein